MQSGLEEWVVSLNTGPATETPDVDGLEREDLKEAIRDWFLSNYEDPAENTPYESAEGGYQYIWGGPYDAREEIEGHFEKLPEEIVEEVVGELERGAAEWAPHSNRIYDEDPPDRDFQPPPYEEIQWHLDQVRRLMAKIEPASSLIGNNRPPEDIGIPPYSDEDKKEIEKAIEVLRKPEAELARDPEGTLRAAEVLKSRGERLREFFVLHGEKFAESFSSQLGKRAADSLTVTLWIALATSLITTFQSVKSFIELYVKLPF